MLLFYLFFVVINIFCYSEPILQRRTEYPATFYVFPSFTTLWFRISAFSHSRIFAFPHFHISTSPHLRIFAFSVFSFSHFRFLRVLGGSSPGASRSLSPRKGYSFFIIFIFFIFTFRDFGRPAQAWGSRPARKPDFGGRGPPGPPHYT